ncbi:PAS domain S-box protein [Marinigracilibium pacificum]|uniref:histidine kinase n=1 Tax=Marinigracilibium pacificum TaxID=2729599 RepID=A0A848J7Q4_9BACT|nr:PAS domain S-box protein [Marinigracilibium pacificum]NMM50419.1 PAS domain S-box protein [Marinigracilibium pacificum]
MKTDSNYSLLKERIYFLLEAADKPLALLSKRDKAIVSFNSNKISGGSIENISGIFESIDLSNIESGGLYPLKSSEFLFCQLVNSKDDADLIYALILGKGDVPNSVIPELNPCIRSNRLIVSKESGVIHSLSDNFCELFNYSREDLIGKKVSEIIGTKAQFLLQKGNTVFNGKLCLGANGEVRWGNLRTMGAYRVNNNEFLIVDFDDLTQSHLRSLQYFQMMRQFGESIIVVDQETLNIIDINSATMNLTGMTQEELISRKVTEILPDIYPSNSGSYQVWVTTIKELSNAGGNYVKRCTLNTAKRQVSVEVSIHYHYLDNRGYFTILLRDITKQLKAEYALKDSREKLRVLFNNVECGILVTSTQNHIVGVNRTFEQMVGFSEPELVGRNIDSIFNEASFNFDVDDILRKKGSNKITTVLNANNEEIFLLNKRSHVYGSDDRVRLHIYMLEDITDYLMTYQKSREQESLLESVNANLKEAIYRCIRGKGLVYANKAFVELFGFNSLEEALETTDSELNNLYLDNKRRKSILLQARNKGFIKGAEARFLRKDGKKWWGLLNCTVNKNHSGEWVIDGAIVDISLRKEAEEKARANQELLKSVNENIHDAIYRSTINDKIIYFNKAFYNLFGFKNEEELMGINPEDLYRNVADRANILKEVLANGSVKNREVPFVRNDGSGFWGLISVSKIVGEDGQVYLNGAIRDITERKIAQLNLKKKNEELNKINSQLDKFVYSASHDLRAPLTSLLGLINIAEKDYDNLEQYFDLMKKSINKQDGFIKDIIDFSRNKEMPESITKVEIDSFFKEILDNLIYSSKNKNIKVNLIISDNHEDLYCDSKRLSIVLSNLISNAFKYADVSKELSYVNINVSIDKNYGVFEVEDNGIGIDSKYIDKIFEMFFRAHDTSYGSGIGLYIVKETVEKMNGQIFVDSVIKKGTKFNVMVPNKVKNFIS